MSDHEFVVNEITSWEDIAELEKAKLVGEVLNQHYPNHLWLVCWQGGAIVVKNLVLGTHYGFILKNTNDHKELSEHAVEAGGELLERAHMPRGAWDGSYPKVLEGSDPRIWQSLNKIQ